MSNEMTNEQKAVKIATYDKWELDDNLIHIGVYYNRETEGGYSDVNLAQIYLTDLNYLVPVAVKVLHQLQEKVPLALAVLHLNTILYEWRNIGIESTYQPLFDAVYDACIYLENQNK